MPESSDLTDNELIAKCLENDAQAWEILVRRYQRLISSIGVKYRFSRDDIADVFQSVVIILLEQLPKLRHMTKLSSWIITVTVRECWKIRHRGGRDVVVDDAVWDRLINTGDDTRPTIEGELLVLERQHQVRRALEALSPQCQSLLTQLFFSKETVSYQDIGRALGMPVASIGPTRGRCLAKLKAIMEKSGFS